MTKWKSFATVLLALALPGLAQAQFGGTATATLSPYDEVPALAAPAVGTFEATVNAAGTEMTYTLHYESTNANATPTITQAHLHFAQPGVNGGIWVFLCSNLGNGPAGTQACPAPPATITGTIQGADVIGGAASQGIPSENLFVALRALRFGRVYVNVHSTLFPGGVTRGQLVWKPNP